MRSRVVTVALVTLFGFAVARSAHAQPSPSKRADDFNEQGKTLMFKNPPDFPGAADKFRQAIVLSPQGKYYYNLCIALSKQGDLGNALMSCQAVGANGASPELKGKADQLADQIKEQLKKQGVSEADVNAAANQGTGNPDNGNPNNGNPDNGNPNNGNPNNGNPDNGNPNNGNPNNGNPNTATPPVGANPNLARFHGAPPPSLFATTPPSHDYTYTFGAALLGGGGSIGSDNAYGSSVGGLRLVGDLLFAAPQKIGAEGYIDFMNVGKADSPTNIGSMNIVDFGVGLYKHFCGGRLCFTPMAGAQIVGYAPSNNPNSSQDFASVGLRLQGSIGYAFGSRYEHFVTVALGADFDAKPIGTYDVDPSDPLIGLDKGAAMFMVSLGYQYRFNTPFGQTPFFQLE